MGTETRALRKTTESFKAEAQAIFGDLYDYTPTVYKGHGEPVEIDCRIHGSFQKLPSAHLQGQGCRQCAIEKRNKLNTHSKEEFVKSARLVQGDKYDYSPTVYVAAMKKVLIGCPTHGEFLQRPHDHLSGYGCPECKNDITRMRCVGNAEEFEHKAREVWGDWYGYSNVVYVNRYVKIQIDCPDHGPFWQTPSNHLGRHGCPKCSIAISKVEIDWLDTLGVPEEHRHKTIRIDGKRYKVDAYDPATNTVYEFYGDYWHGNPEVFWASDINPSNYKSFGELYKKTMRRERIIKAAGYTVVTVWEKNFKAKRPK